MNISDYLQESMQHPNASNSLRELNPLRDDISIDEIYPVEVSIDMLRAVAVVVFDCRFADSFSGNTGILVVRGLGKVNWTEHDLRPIRQRNVTSWVTTSDQTSWKVVASLESRGMSDVHIQGTHANFHCGNVFGVDEAPPDLSSGENDETHVFPRLSSVFTPLWMTASHVPRDE
jgi:hypothetical protein